MPALHSLPRFSDGWSFLYVEHARIERDQNAIVILDARGRLAVPVASLSVLMLGPGTAATHAAMVALGENGCSVVWSGEAGVRLYVAGGGETRTSANLMAQATAWADPVQRLEVVKRLYRMRFPEALRPELTLQQLRGMEGVRVRETYAEASRTSGVKWSGRAYKRDHWDAADPVNRALSTANACLYGICHAALISTGFSPGLGFIHTGRMLSFVYDVADLYKCDVTIPVAFESARDDWKTGFESRVRRACRQIFWEKRLLERIVPDIQMALGLRPEPVEAIAHVGTPVGDLWDPETGSVAGGQNWAKGEVVPTETSSDADDDQNEDVPF
jgi:CRISP-associated protein Cas1